MKKKTIGYVVGTFDMFHIGHLNIIRNAKSRCDYLIVGVSTDEVIKNNKGKTPIIPYKDRVDIVESIKYVDKVITQYDYGVAGKVNAVKENNIDIIFVGSDWQGTDKWKMIEQEIGKLGARVEYLPYTESISSTILRNKLVPRD